MSTSYLEQYLDSLDSLPIELQRNFTLMRELDSRAQDVMKTIDRVAEDYLDNMKHYSKDKKKEILSDVQKYFDKTKEYGDDKVQLAIQTYEMVDKYIRKLDTDLARFEQEIQEKALKNTTGGASGAGGGGGSGGGNAAGGASKTKRGRKKAKDKAEPGPEITLEVCVDSVQSALAAVQGGANRLELCAALSEGGLTPTLGLYQVVKRLVLDIPVFVMIRARPGFDFVFSDAEKDVMRADCRLFAQHRVDGFVIGALTGEQEIDLAFVRDLAGIIKDRPVTFHRAFDVVRDPMKSLRELIDLGFVTRVLTSGQRCSVADGLPLLRQLQEINAGRLSLMPGSGVNRDNVRAILSLPGVTEVHLSGKRSVPSSFRHEKEVCEGDSVDVTDAGLIREIRRIVDSIATVAQ